MLLVGPISSAACALRTPYSSTHSQAKAQWTGAGFACPGSVSPSSASGKFPSLTPDLEDLSTKVPPLPQRQESQAEQIGCLLWDLGSDVQTPEAKMHHAHRDVLEKPQRSSHPLDPQGTPQLRAHSWPPKEPV